MEKGWQSPGALRRPGHHVLEDLEPTWSPWSSEDGVVPASGWGQEWAADAGFKDGPAGRVRASPSVGANNLESPERSSFSSTVTQHMRDSSGQERRHPQAACHSFQGSVGPSRPTAHTPPWPLHPGFPRREWASWSGIASSQLHS